MTAPLPLPDNPFAPKPMSGRAKVGTGFFGAAVVADAIALSLFLDARNASSMGGFADYIVGLGALVVAVVLGLIGLVVASSQRWRGGREASISWLCVAAIVVGPVMFLLMSG